jgi:hypothetical protein
VVRTPPLLGGNGWFNSPASHSLSMKLSDIYQIGFMANTLVTRATTRLRRLANGRTNRTVTADDVQNFLNAQNFNGDTNERLSIVRQVLSPSNFRPAGYTVPSNRPEARGREISVWTA